MRKTMGMVGAWVLTAVLAGCGWGIFSSSDRTCGTPRTPAPCRCPELPPSPVHELLEYHRYAHALSLPELEIELHQRAAALAPGACTLDRLRVALLLQRRPIDDSDAAASEDVLLPCLDEPGAPSLPVRHLAHLLRVRLEERREQYKRLRELDQSLKAERQRTAELSQQLEALKDIERSILERERGERSQQDAAKAPRRPTAQGKARHGP